MLGTLKLPLRGKKHYTVAGGPYIEKPKHMHGVKMAREVPFRLDDGITEISVPTRDYSIPSNADLIRGLISAVHLISHDQPLYVGCMGGRGRTGLFLAVLAKAYGIKDPVEYVRENYYAHAVETAEQYKFVQNFEIPKSVLKKIKHARARSWFKMRDQLTIDPSAVPDAAQGPWWWM